jgi:D-amino-acid oxidase
MPDLAGAGGDALLAAHKHDLHMDSSRNASYSLNVADSNRIIVIGAGVSGLTTALCLAESGLNVQLISDKLPRATTSAAAGALWGPYVSEDPRVLGWSLESLPDLEAIAGNRTSGVHFGLGVEASREKVAIPAYLSALPDFSICSGSDLPDGFVCGWRYTAPLFDMPLYLNYLIRRLAESDVRVDIIDQPLRSIFDVAAEASTIVNCTGLGAKDLVPDPTLFPGWGQLVVVDNPGIHDFFSDFPESDEPIYFIPHQDHVVLGGAVSFKRTGLQPDLELADRIVQRCAAVEPRFRQSRILGYRVGLRPVRSLVRLEREQHDGTVIVHNYGHGGSGITLSWGCARQVMALIG